MTVSSDKLAGFKKYMTDIAASVEVLASYSGYTGSMAYMNRSVVRSDTCVYVQEHSAMFMAKMYSSNPTNMMGGRSSNPNTNAGVMKGGTISGAAGALGGLGGIWATSGASAMGLAGIVAGMLTLSGDTVTTTPADREAMFRKSMFDEAAKVIKDIADKLIKLGPTFLYYPLWFNEIGFPSPYGSAMLLDDAIEWVQMEYRSGAGVPWGLYTLTSYGAMALAVALGGAIPHPKPPENPTGILYLPHYHVGRINRGHEGTHMYNDVHIWYGSPFIF